MRNLLTELNATQKRREQTPCRVDGDITPQFLLDLVICLKLNPICVAFVTRIKVKVAEGKSATHLGGGSLYPCPPATLHALLKWERGTLIADYTQCVFLIRYNRTSVLGLKEDTGDEQEGAYGWISKYSDCSLI